MDNLLEALQSGAAFRDRRKRIPRNPGKTPLSSLGLSNVNVQSQGFPLTVPKHTHTKKTYIQQTEKLDPGRCFLTLDLSSCLESQQASLSP